MFPGGHMATFETKIRFDRMEWAGSLGDLGTLLPLAIGMIVICGLRATNVLVTVGGFYLLAGLYFRTPISVQPMKVIGAYAIASGLTPQQITAAGLWMGGILLLLGTTGLVDRLRKLIPKSAVRGIQLTVGVVLLVKGLKLVVQPDPNLVGWSLGPIHAGVIIGVVGLAVTLLLLGNKRVPAALVLVALGLVAGLILGRPPGAGEFDLGLHLPRLLPHGWAGWDDLLWVLPVLVLPQLPATLGNAIISNVDLSHELYPESRKRVTLRAVTLSQALANLASFALGGIPMCHGAGGLAAHYRFGARTAGSNLIIGGILVLLALALGENLVPVLGLLPLAVLGVLLAFAGMQLSLMICDLEDRKDLFVVLFMLVLSLAVNLAVGFGVGIALAWVLKSERVEV